MGSNKVSNMQIHGTLLDSMGTKQVYCVHIACVFVFVHLHPSKYKHAYAADVQLYHHETSRALQMETLTMLNDQGLGRWAVANTCYLLLFFLLLLRFFSSYEEIVGVCPLCVCESCSILFS